MRGRRPRLIGALRAVVNLPDPNSPNSPDYAERHVQHSFVTPEGLLRIDAGAPLAAPGREIAALGSPSEPEAEPACPPIETSVLPVQSSSNTPEPDWRKQYGLGRGG